MYILIGRTPDYAWSLTSADGDVRDVYAERLCEPDGSAPTRASTHYVYRGECRPFENFDAGLFNGQPIRYPVSVHGPVFATATVKGEPYALSRKRSTFGRDALNLAALKDMTEGKATTPRRFCEHCERVRLHLQLGLRVAQGHVVLLLGTLPRHRRASTGACRRWATGIMNGPAFSARASIPMTRAAPMGCC